jgi:hypothetical protein
MKRVTLDSQNSIGIFLKNIGIYLQAKSSRVAFKDALILIFLVFLLGILIYPSLFLKSSEYRAGSIAIEDVKADRDFLVEDKVSTEAKKASILKVTPAVFDFDPRLPVTLQSHIVQLFENISAEMLQTASKQSKYGGNTATEKDYYLDIARNYLEKNFGIPLTEEEFTVFYREKFSTGSARAICKLIDKIYYDTYVSGHRLSKLDMERGIIVHDIKTQQESLITEFRHFTDTGALNSGLSEKADRILDGYGRDFRWAAASLVSKMIRPNIVLNTEATEEKKREAVSAIKPFFFQILKNEMIVREGERITQTTEDKLDAYYAIKGGKGKKTDVISFLGFMLVVLIMGTALHYPVRQWNPRSHDLRTTLLFLALTVLLQFLLIRFGLIISDAVARAFPVLSAQDCFYAIPFVTGSMLVALLINDRIAVLFSVFSAFITGFLFDSRIIIPLFSLMGSLFAVYQISAAKQRSAFFVTGLLLGFMNGVIIFALYLFTVNSFDWRFLVNLLMGVIGGVASGILVSGTLPLFESLFKFTTDIKLLELGNLNQPIFQRMIIEAPGTYHHCIIVASLVESAAESIGANALLAKVSAYYHDIGKMAKPQYFIENQQTGENKHDRLSPKMSSLIIISHVKDGCEFARQLKLGNPIIDIIRQHHGTGLVTFFYDKAKRDPDANINTLSDSDFRYPGPKPQTKEAGLVLLGDVIEASSRALADPTPARIKNLVHERIERIFLDGQLDECELTLRDLNKIAESFIRILTGIFHHRISYPEQAASKDGNGVKLQNVIADR